jgi:hypothetical protein
VRAAAGDGIDVRSGAVPLTPEQDALAYLAITRLQNAYADVITRRAWPELAALFTPDAPVHVDMVTLDPIELVGPEQIGEFIGTAVSRFDFFELVILSAVVDVQSETEAVGRFYMQELRQDAASGGWTDAYGVYHDRYAHDGERWRFAERSYQTLARTSRFETFPFPERFRSHVTHEA